MKRKLSLPTLKVALNKINNDVDSNKQQANIKI